MTKVAQSGHQAAMTRAASPGTALPEPPLRHCARATVCVLARSTWKTRRHADCPGSTQGACSRVPAQGPAAECQVWPQSQPGTAQLAPPRAACPSEDLHPVACSSPTAPPYTPRAAQNETSTSDGHGLLPPRGQHSLRVPGQTWREDLKRPGKAAV